MLPGHGGWCGTSPAPGWRSSSTPTPAAWVSTTIWRRLSARHVRPTRCRRLVASSPPIRRWTVAFAELVVEQFAEVVIAPGYDDAAREVFARKKNLRVLEAQPADSRSLVVRDVDGGFLIQESDAGWDGEDREVVTERPPSEDELRALELAWRVVKHVSSNAIVVGVEDRIIGIGAGQMSRVDAAKISVAKATEMDHVLDGQRCCLRRLLSFPGRGRSPARGGCAGGHPAWRIDSRPRGHRGLQPAGSGDGADAPTALPALTPAQPFRVQGSRCRAHPSSER